MTEPGGMRTVVVTRYVTPLREGGSLPAIAEADDGFLYVVKFRGAGQGPKALIADLLGGEIARLLGLKTPELVRVELDEAFGRAEADEEIQDLLKASVGLNLGSHYLSGALTYDPVAVKITPEQASLVVWLDAYLTNIDRTARNTNMLLWHKELWLIDHGAALYFHHSWEDVEGHAKSPFALIAKHVLLPLANDLAGVDAWAKTVLTEDVLRSRVALIPDAWLENELAFSSPEDHRDAYVRFLVSRLNNSLIFVNEANRARKDAV